MTQRTVLIAENEGIISLDIKNLLRNNDYHAVIARSAQDLMDKYNEEKPDLVVADLFLNKESIEKVLRHIRHQDNTPLILLSGASKNVLERLAQSLLPCAYLSKPFDKSELLKTIENYVVR